MIQVTCSTHVIFLDLAPIKLSGMEKPYKHMLRNILSSSNFIILGYSFLYAKDKVRNQVNPKIWAKKHYSLIGEDFVIWQKFTNVS